MRKIVVIIVVFLFVVITSYVLMYKSEKSKKDTKINEYLKTYDILVGYEQTYMFSSERVLYGYKNGQLIKIDNDYPNDKSNFYEITGTNDFITYFDYDTWYKLYKEMDYTEYGMWGIDEQHRELFMNYYNNYAYDSNDLAAFNKMLQFVAEKYKLNNTHYDLSCFIINENDYFLYVYVGDNHIMYHYNSDNNKLDKLFDSPEGGLAYFKVGKK